MQQQSAELVSLLCFCFFIIDCRAVEINSWESSSRFCIKTRHLRHREACTALACQVRELDEAWFIKLVSQSHDVSPDSQRKSGSQVMPSLNSYVSIYVLLEKGWRKWVMKLFGTGRNKFVVKQKAYILTQMSCKPMILHSKSLLAIFPLLYKAALTSLIFRVLVVSTALCVWAGRSSAAACED